MKVGDKVKGFKFVNKIHNDIRYHEDIADKYIGQEGEVTLLFEHSYQITFKDGFSYSYPYLKPQTDSIVESVINQFKQRSEAGINKYGTTLDRNDLSTLEWLTHLSEELMDATLYIEKLKQELK